MRHQNRRMTDLAAVEAAIYDQSFRALDEQARVIDALRTRASPRRTESGERPGTHGRLDPASWVAIGLFVSVVLLTLFVVTPRTNTALAHHPDLLVCTYLNREQPVSLGAYRRAIAFYNGRNFDANARQLRALDATFAVASVCLGCELVVWLWILAS